MILAVLTVNLVAYWMMHAFIRRRAR